MSNNVIMLKTDSSPISALILEHFEDHIQASDTKAQLAIAANTLLAAAVSLSDKGFAQQFPEVINPKDFLTALSSLLLLGALIVSVYYALLTIRPNIIIKGQTIKSLFYFGYVANIEEAQFVQEFMAQDGEAIQRALLAQVHAKSKIAMKKFVTVRRSINTLFGALILWTLLQLVQIFL